MRWAVSASPDGGGCTATTVADTQDGLTNSHIPLPSELQKWSSGDTSAQYHRELATLVEDVKP